MNLKSRNGSFLIWLSGTGILLFLNLLTGLGLLSSVASVDGGGVTAGLFVMLFLDVAGLAGILYKLAVSRKRIRRTQDRLHQIFGAQELEQEPLTHDIFLFPELLETACREKELAKRDYENKLLKKEAELNILQSQINPHFLYNALDAIRGDIVEEGLGDTADMVEALAKFFRYSINMKNNIITLEEELDNLDNYFKIIQYRFENRFYLINDCDYGNAALMEYKIPKLIIQPIVENSINHGLEPKTGMGIIHIRSTFTNRYLEILIQDNGIGMKQAELEQLLDKFNDPAASATGEKPKKGGIALINVNKRIKLYYGEEYGLEINSLEQLGTEVKILLPPIEEKGEQVS